MSVEDARREALAELRELLAAGVEPASAIREASASSGLREDVVARIGEVLVREQSRLIDAKRNSDARADRTRRIDEVLRRYRAALKEDPNAKSDAIESQVGVSDLSKDEASDLFMRTMHAWLDRNI